MMTALTILALVFSQVPPDKVELPASARSDKEVAAFLAGAEDVAILSAPVRQRPLTLYFVSRRRKNPEPYKEREGRFVVLDARGAVNVRGSSQLNRVVPWLSDADQDDCGASDGVTELLPYEHGVAVVRFYAPGTAHMSCTTYLTVSNAGKWSAEESEPQDSSLGADVHRQRLLELKEARRLWRDGQRDAAVTIWEEHVEVSRKGPYAWAGSPEEALNNLGYAHWESKDYSTAEPLLLEVTKRTPERAVAWLNLGDLYRDTNRPVEARAAYERFGSMNITAEQRKMVESRLASLPTPTRKRQ